MLFGKKKIIMYTLNVMLYLPKQTMKINTK